MTKWISVLALLLCIAGIILFWFDSRNSKDRIALVETQLNNALGDIKLNAENIGTLSKSVEEISQHTGKLLSETGKLMAEKESVESEMQTLRSNPASLIDILSYEPIEKGLFNIQTKILKINVRNKSRFNVKEIQVSVWYLKDDQTESGVTAQFYIRDILVAGQTKWFEIENAPWIDGRPGAKMSISQVVVVEK